MTSTAPAARRPQRIPLVLAVSATLAAGTAVSSPAATSAARASASMVSALRPASALTAVTAARKDPTTVAAKDRVPFRLGSRDLTAAEKRAMTGVVWRKGCPVPLEHLKRVSMRYSGFDGKTYSGVLVVHRNAVPAVRVAFGRMFAAGVPIRRMQPIEAYGGSAREVDGSQQHLRVQLP